MTAAAGIKKLAEQAAAPLKKLTQELTAAQNKIDQLEVERAKVLRAPMNDSELMQSLTVDVENRARAYQKSLTTRLASRRAPSKKGHDPMTLFVRSRGFASDPGSASPIDENALSYFFGGQILQALGGCVEDANWTKGISSQERAQRLQKIDDEVSALKAKIATATSELDSAGYGVTIT